MSSASWQGALLSFGLIIIAIAVSRWWKIPAEKDIALGSVRAFVQLIAVGYLLQYVFALASLSLILLVLFVMLLVGAWTASRASDSTGVKDSNAPTGASPVHRSMWTTLLAKNSFLLCFVAMSAGSLITLGLMLVAGIITLEARYIIPLAGMIISNAMNASALTLNRLESDLSANKAAVETSLALGRSWREASLPFQRDAARAGMISILNFLKTVGIVALPGAMTGMILAGAEPLEAVLFQIVVAFMLVSAVTITSVITLELSVRQHFTPFHQLRSPLYRK